MCGVEKDYLDGWDIFQVEWFEKISTNWQNRAYCSKIDWEDSECLDLVCTVFQSNSVVLDCAL